MSHAEAVNILNKNPKIQKIPYDTKVRKRRD